MKVLVAGGSGLVGQALCRFLEGKGHDIFTLSRSEDKGDIVWDPSREEVDAAALEGFDAFINLAGENIMGRWTPAKKKAILDTRLQATNLLAKAILQLKSPPSVFINASATGIYGDRQENIVDEESLHGGGFLADVCQQWEAAATHIASDNTRVAMVRIGVVLSKKGGALARMLIPFKLGLGGCVGSGQQYMSWVSLNELVHIFDFVLRNSSIEGPVNAVAPCPVTNREFTLSLGKILKRPTFFALPAFAARLLFGELADELLLASTRVHPTKLQRAGYTYCEPHLEAVLRRETTL